MHILTKRILAGDIRAAARAISLIENDEPERERILREIYPHTGKAQLIGITGAPGAGKSSLVDSLIEYLRMLGLRVGVVAVDPTSPFTGGAILGDRVRMQNHALDSGVFIRSMGTRGSLGGLSRKTRDAIRVLDAFGCQVVLIETVGVGQSELDVMHIADTTVVVLTPGAGDTVQAFKAGIMEIADLFVINKSDLPGADRLQTEIEQMLDLAKHDAAWRPPVVRTVSLNKTGLPELWSQITTHQQYLSESGTGTRRRTQRLHEEVLEIMHEQLFLQIKAKLNAELNQPLIEDVVQGQRDPYTAAAEMLRTTFMKEP